MAANLVPADSQRWELDMEFDLDRMAQFLTVALFTLAAVIILGPGAPSVLAQHAADRALVRLRRRR
jgi:hypothetical protein